MSGISRGTEFFFVWRLFFNVRELFLFGSWNYNVVGLDGAEAFPR
jgi:hypothetical protein